MSMDEARTGAMKTAQGPGFRWGRAALVVSLTLNFLFLGLVGGAVLHRVGPRADAPPPGGDLLSYGPYTHAFSPEDRKALRALLKRDAADLRDNRRAVRRGFDQVVAALRAQPYDAAAVQALLEQQQAGVAQQVSHVSGLMLEHIARMSDAERAAFADRLEEVLRRGPSRHSAATQREE
ncbi:periplasmic heavy metal sensor [Actibacterium sp. D379-3]